MAVIALPNISPQTSGGAAAEWGLASGTGANSGPWGALQTVERPGATRRRCTLRYENLSDPERAIMQQFLENCRGQANRFYVPDFSRLALRGSFPTSELLTNNSFASGTTGYQAGTGASLTASDGKLRASITANAAGYTVGASSAATVVQYAPYTLRALVHAGRGAFASSGLRLGSSALGTQLGEYTTTGTGLLTTTIVPTGTSAYFGFSNYETGLMVGDYFEASYVSLSRCALVDNGPNDLLQSDAFGTTWAATRVTVSNVQTAPDGTVTGDRIIEDSSAANTHFVSQNVTCATGIHDRQFTVALRIGSGRAWAAIQLQENTGNQVAHAWFDVQNGVIGTVAADGVSWTNARAFISPMGGGWYQCTLVARKASAATSLTARIYVAEADMDVTFDGDGASFICAWRATLSASSVPARLRQTTVALTAGASQTGDAVHLKGLPASTSGLLLQGDRAEIITSSGSHFARASAPLNSDAAGLGYFQFEPPLRFSPADGAAVIVHRPLMRSMLESNSVQWTESGGEFSDLEFTAAEDLVPA